MHCLIIEDEEMFVSIIEYALRGCGFNTFDIASTTREAIDAAARRWPDLITADVSLAEGDGIEAIQVICPQTSMPVIFITGRPAAEVRALISDYPVIHKPFSEQTLTYTIASAMKWTRFGSPLHQARGRPAECH